MENEKIIASFELVLMVVGIFAFSYGVAMTDESFVELDKRHDVARAEMLASLNNSVPQKSATGVMLDYIFGKLKEPMVPVVSAVDANGVDGIDLDELDIGNTLWGGYLVETDFKSTYEISSQASDTGCCFVSKDGQMCGSAVPSECVDDGPFQEGVFCADSWFCEKGCCYNEDAGTYDGNVLEVDCPASWINDPNCNMPEARKGCCILGSDSHHITYRECEVRVNNFAQGDGTIDWRGGLNSAQCMILSVTQKEGACVVANGGCKFGTEASCYGYGGNFYENFLCTSPQLNTSCEMTEQTTCVDGKDGVYFLDSCGNVANIYDSNRASDPTYWDLVALPEDLCGDSDVEGGNANSPDCGNCNRWAGGICGSASEDNFNVNLGEFYCKDTSCMFDGENYESGESWCVYDGAIGNGDDVVGSRHWKYVCSQGTTQIEPCADYRNQICIQANTFDMNGTDVEFRNANCVANNWRACINLNSEEDGMDECEDTLNCRVEKVDIADKFKFDVCLPKYPGGFSLKDERYMVTADQLCGMADQTCTVVYKPKMFGGCKLIANGDCLTEKFAQGMNDYCRKLGDCGGEVNVLGEYSSNYEVVKSPYLSQGSINELKELAKPVPGQFAEVENYTNFLEAAGLWGNPEEAPEAEEVKDYSDEMMMGAVGVAGIVYAGVALGLFGTATVAATGLYATLPGLASFLSSFGAGSAITGTPVATAMAPWAGAAIGAAIGFIAGMMIAKAIGLSPGGSILMAVGGAMVGGAIGFGFIAGFAALGPLGWALLIIGVILIVVSLFFGGDDCPPIEVEFDCKPWKAPVGGGDCEKCNEDPLKPCSEYRCNSLGAACELINKGTEQEICHANKDDGKAPILRPATGTISDSEMYGGVTDSGFAITNSYGDCVEAYTPLNFGIDTDELAYCKFDIEPKEFGAMSYDLGANAYLYNHTTVFTLPDPSHGQSQGSNWTGDLNLFIKCQDTHGHETPDFYIVDMCVKEGDDITAPIVRGIDPANDAIVGFDVSSENVTIIMNEVSTCKWDYSDVIYSAMGNSMECNDSLIKQSSPLGYVCTNVLPVENSSNTYYIRCLDQPWLGEVGERNANSESYVYTLRKPSDRISIEKIAPNTDFEIDTAVTTVDLKIQTANGGEYHFCSYSLSGYEVMNDILGTGGERVHNIPINRPTGLHKIYVECRDETGDFARGETEFRIVRDGSNPQIARTWQSNGKLYIITNEDAECQYTTTSCRFNWGDGEFAGTGSEHIVSVTKGDTYYIKCEDEFGHAPVGCSMEIRAL